MIEREVTYCAANTSDGDSIEDWSGCFHRRTTVRDIHYRSSKNRNSDKPLLQWHLKTPDVRYGYHYDGHVAHNVQ